MYKKFHVCETAGVARGQRKEFIIFHYWNCYLHMCIHKLFPFFQEFPSQAVFNHTEDYVMFPDEMTTSLCCWDSRNASRKQLLSLGHNGAVRFICHSPTEAAFLTCSDDFRARFWFKRQMPSQRWIDISWSLIYQIDVTYAEVFLYEFAIGWKTPN